MSTTGGAPQGDRPRRGVPPSPRLASASASASTATSTTSKTPGHLILTQPHHRGLRVLGAHVVHASAPSGPDAPALRTAPPLDLSPVATQPSLRAAQAIAAARTAVSEAAQTETTHDETSTAELLIDAPPTAHPRLAYQVTLTSPSAFRAHRVLVDAHTGAVLRVEDLVSPARARVFPHSPAVDDAPAERQLSRLPAAAETLASDELLVQGCPDTRRCTEVFPSTFLHSCEPLATAFADDAGDFLAHAYDGDHRTPDDPFAEVQVYAHISTVFDRLDQLGVAAPIARPLRVLVNYRAFAPGSLRDCEDGVYLGDGELSPFDNAFFAPGGHNVGATLGDTLVFGQGHAVDFAYDLDVVAHELGHAVLQALAPDLGRGHVDELGYDPTPAALHEGLPDLLAYLASGDPVLGEYVGSGLGVGTPLRSLAGDATCPADLTGRAHSDSLPFTQAIHDARAALAPGDRDAFDRALLDAQAALGAYDGFDAAVALVLAELRASLGDATARDLAARFAERGLPGCGDRTVEGGAARFTLFAEGVPPRPTPAPLQIRYQLDEPADALVFDLRFLDVPVYPDEVTVDAVLASGRPIRWRSEPDGAVGDHTHAAPLVVADDGSARATLEGPFEPGTYVLMLLNRGPQAVVHGARIGHVPSPSSAAGCGCQASGGAGAPWLVLLALTRRRGRAASRARRSPRRRPGPPPSSSSSC